MDNPLELNCYFITYVWIVFSQILLLKFSKTDNLKIGLFRWISFILSISLIFVLYVMYYNVKGITPTITVTIIGLFIGFITISTIKELNKEGYTEIFYFIWPIYFLSLYGKLRPYITF